MSTRSAGQAISSADLQVLIITDERKFNRTAFFEMFDGFDGLVWTEVKHPEALDLICSDSIGKFDALVFYDMPENVVLSDEQKQCTTLGVPSDAARYRCIRCDRLEMANTASPITAVAAIGAARFSIPQPCAALGNS